MNMRRLLLAISVVLALVVTLAVPVQAIPADSFETIIFVHYPWDKVPEGVPPAGPLSGISQESCPVCSDPNNCEDYGYDGIHWPDDVVLSQYGVVYYVNLSGSNDDGGFLAAVEAAAQTWENDPDSYMNLTARDDPDIGNSSLRNRRDGINAVTWNNLRRYPGAIAVTFAWYNTVTLEIVEVDLAFNNGRGFNWSSNQDFSGDLDTDTGNPNAYDVQNIATHEFGHWLLLNDLYEGNQQNLTMYGYGGMGELKKRTLDLGDELGIRTIYPSSAVVYGDIDGIVISASDNNPMEGAAVVVEDTGQSAITNAAGYYFIADVPVGDHTISASAPSFQSDTKTAIVYEELTTTVNFALSSEPTGEVSVTSIAPNSMNAGSTIQVVITGSGFVGGADVAFEDGKGPAPTASNIVVVDTESIEATVTVKKNGPTGTIIWDVRVTNPDGSSGVLTDAFTVIR